jgi:hypothetical protein
MLLICCLLILGRKREGKERRWGKRGEIEGWETRGGKRDVEKGGRKREKGMHPTALIYPRQIHSDLTHTS